MLLFFSPPIMPWVKWVFFDFYQITNQYLSTLRFPPHPGRSTWSHNPATNQGPQGLPCHGHEKSGKPEIKWLEY